MPSPDSCSTRSTPSSVRSPRRCADRCGCWPAPAPARPGRSPTGSPTASPPGVYEPTEVLAVTFTTRAAGEMRTRLRQLGAGGVQARTFHSAALRQLRFFWPHVYGTDLPTLTESKISLLAAAARRCRVAADQALLRDLASEIEWAKVSNVHPDDYARLAAGRGRDGHRPRPGDRGPDVLRLRGRQAQPGPDGHGGRAALRRRAAGRGRAGRRPGPPAVQVVRRRRVPGRLAAPVRAARPVARRPRRALRRRRPRPDDLLLRRRAGRLPPRLPRQVPRHDLDRAGPQLPLHAPGRRRRQPAAVRHRPARASSCAPSSRPAPRSPTPGTPTRWPRPRRSPTGCASLAATGTPYGQIAVLFRINAQSEAFEEALTERGIPYVVRGAARFFDRPEVRQAVTLLRGTARSGGGRRRPGRRPSGPRSPAWAGRPRRPTARGQVRDRWESLAGAGRPGDRVRRGPTAPTSTASSTSSTGAPPSSTPRSPTASRWPPSTPPRAWSGTPCSLAGSRRARCRSPTPTRPPRSRRSGGCSTSA